MSARKPKYKPHSHSQQLINKLTFSYSSSSFCSVFDTDFFVAFFFTDLFFVVVVCFVFFLLFFVCVVVIFFLFV